MFALSPEYKLQRRAIEAEAPAQPVLQITLVGKMQQTGVVDEENEGRGINARLGDVGHLALLPLPRWRRMRSHHFPHLVVKQGCGKTLLPLLINTPGCRKHLVNALAEPGRGVNGGGAGEEFQLLLYLAGALGFI